VITKLKEKPVAVQTPVYRKPRKASGSIRTSRIASPRKVLPSPRTTKNQVKTKLASPRSVMHSPRVEKKKRVSRADRKKSAINYKMREVVETKVQMKPSEPVEESPKQVLKQSQVQNLSMASRLKEIDRKFDSGSKPASRQMINDLRESINLPEFGHVLASDECLLDISLEGGLADLTDEDIFKPKEEEWKINDEPTVDGVSSRMAKIGKTKENSKLTSLIAKPSRQNTGSLLKRPQASYQRKSALIKADRPMLAAKKDRLSQINKPR